MTCIVAVVHNGTVYMGADSAGVNGWSQISRKDPKIYTVQEFLIGFTTSFRMGQLLAYNFVPPPIPQNESIERYMVKHFVEELRKVFKDGGYTSIENSTERGGSFLVGYKGRIFHIEPDFQVGESNDQFDAVGCGRDAALGSLYSTRSLYPKERLRLALESAERYNIGVRAPFIYAQTNE